MKTKKINAIVLLAALIITALLVTTCMDPLEISGSSPPSPEGRSYLRLNTEGVGDGRTIMPSTVISDFDMLTVSISSTTATDVVATHTANQYSTLTALQAVNFAVLNGETYTIEIRAYIDFAGTGAISASGSASKIISAGANSETINLLPVITGTDQGTFEWDITLPASPAALTTANLQIFQMNGTTQVGSTEDLNLSTTGTRNLNPGFYQVVVTLSETGYQDRVIREVLHIYPDQTSEWSPLQFANLNVNVYTVTYNINGGTPTSLPSPVTGVLHGNTITTAPSIPSHDTLAFDAWYTAASGGIKWVFDTVGNGGSRVIRNTTLYAQWVAPTQLNLNAVFDISDMNPNIDITTVSQDDILSSNVTITLTSLPAWYSSGSAQWSCGTKTWTGDSITLTPADVYEILVIGDLDFSVIIYDGITPYSKTFTINVTQ